MKINWKSYLDLPIEIRESLYTRNISDEVKNFIEFEKSLREEPEGEEILEFTEEPQDNEIIIIKGDDETMNEYENLELNELLEIFAEEEFEFEKAEKELPKEAIDALKRAYKVLLKYKGSMNEDLKRAMTVITRYIGIKYPYPEPYPVKKLEKEPKIFDWKSFINEDLEEDIEEREEIEKSLDPDDKFPSVTAGLIRGNRKREKAKSEREISLGRRFI